MTKVSALPLAKLVIHVVARTTLNLNARIGQEGPMNLSQGMTQEGQMEPNLLTEKIDACRCNVHEIHEDGCHDDSSIEDLNEQVQSLKRYCSTPMISRSDCTLMEATDCRLL